MKKKLLALWLCLGAFALAQNPQTQTAPIYQVNAKYVQGVGFGYWPTIGSGLTLDLTAGTSCLGTTYAGGALSMTASVTNYVYLNSSCVPAVKTSAFVTGDIPIAIVVAGASTITSVNDVRTPFQSTNNGGGISNCASLPNAACTNLSNSFTGGTQQIIAPSGAIVNLIVKASSGSSGSPNFIQENTNGTPAGPISVAFLSNVTSGSGIVVSINEQLVQLTGDSCSDTLGNTFNLVAQTFSGDAAGLRVFLATSSPAGADTVTCVNSASNGINSISINEYGGGISSVDGTAAVYQTSGEASTIPLGPVTTTVANDLLFSVISYDNMSPEGDGPAGYTVRSFIDENGLQTADATASSPGNYSTSWPSSTAGGPLLGILIPFKLNASGSQTADLLQAKTAAGLIESGISPYGIPFITPNPFSFLPACASLTEGITASVTDSTTSTQGATVVGGGSNHVSAYCNGTEWVVTSGNGTASVAWGSITGTLASQGDLATALAAKAPLASPLLTGTPTAPTQSCASNTDIATGAYVAACGGGNGVQYNSNTTVNYFYGDSLFVVSDTCYISGTSSAAPITAWSISSNVVTFTSTQSYQAGNVVTLSQFGTSTFFNGQTVTVLSAGLSGSQWEANFTHGNGSATENGLAGCSYNAPGQAALLPFFNTHGTVIQGGIGGAETTTLNSDYTANVHPYSPAITSNPGYLYIQIGTNDLIATSSTPSTIEANLQALWATAHADGWTIVQETIPPNGFNSIYCSGNCVAYWNQLNDFIRGAGNTGVAGGSSPCNVTPNPCHWDRLADIAAVTNSFLDSYIRIQTGSEAGHFTDPGNALQANLLNQAAASQGTAMTANFICSYWNYCATTAGSNTFESSNNTQTIEDSVSGAKLNLFSIDASGAYGITDLIGISGTLDNDFVGNLVQWYAPTSSNPVMYLNSGEVFGFSQGGSGSQQPPDVALSRDSSNANTMDLGTGSQGSTAGNLALNNLTVHGACSGCASGIANAQLTMPTGSISANSCTSVTTVTMTGLIAPSGSTPGSTFSTSFESDPSAVTGWGANGGLTLIAWVSAANTASWEVCNQTSSSITAGAINVDLGAK